MMRQELIPIILLLLLATLPLLAQEETAIYSVPKSTEEIKVDGELSEALWENALVLELEYEIFPGYNIPATYKTEVLLSYSESAFVVGIRCYDPDPGAIRARLTDRDSDPGDDYLGIILDTFNDQRSGYQFWTNPRGVQMDRAVLDGQVDTSWDAIYYSKGQITEWGWSGEISIPFSSINFQQSEKPQIWGFNAQRKLPRNSNKEFSLTQEDRDNNCDLCQAIKIMGFEGVSPGKNFIIGTTVTGVNSSSRNDFPDGDFTNDKSELEGGISAQWGLTNNSDLAVTLNPDFSQVEADSYQLDINTRFALSYEEKRPFFTEGSDYFSTPMSAVYTRTIRDPEWGVKYTGKHGANSYGFFSLQDSVTNLIIPGREGSNTTSLDMSSQISVFRYKRDVGKNSSLGLLYTGREGADYFNHVAGFDGNFYLTKKDRIQFQFLGSSTAYPENVANSFNQNHQDIYGKAMRVKYNHNERSWSWNLSYDEINDGFRADGGYMPQVSYKYLQGQIMHKIWNESESWWHVVLLVAGHNNRQTLEGKSLQKVTYGAMIVQGALSSSVEVVPSRSATHYLGQEFDLKQVSFTIRTIPDSRITLRLSGKIGDSIDYAHVRQGEQGKLSPSIIFTPTSSLNFYARHTYQRLDAGGSELYTANVSELTVSYQLSLKTRFRATWQKVLQTRNLENYVMEVDTKSDNIFTQLLFSYKVNPLTVLYLGYSDNYFGNQNYDLTQADRTLFFKIGYAWQL